MFFALGRSHQVVGGGYCRSGRSGLTGTTTSFVEDVLLEITMWKDQGIWHEDEKQGIRAG